MGAVKVDGRNGPDVESVEEMAGRFSSELMTLMPRWRQKLIENTQALLNNKYAMLPLIVLVFLFLLWIKLSQHYTAWHEIDTWLLKSFQT